MTLYTLADSEFSRLHFLARDNATPDDLRNWALKRIQAMQDRFFGEEEEEAEA